MEEQRLRNYLGLIYALLSCSNGQELIILQRHQNFLDQELLLLMVQVAESLRQEGREDDANRLGQIATHLVQRIPRAGITKTSKFSSIPDDLQTILQVLEQPGGLQDMARRVALCQQALSLVSCQDNEELWAKLQGMLGNSLAQNSQGSLAENIEGAIEAYQHHMQVVTRRAMPVEWAHSMMNLANAYQNRIEGSRVENIEKSIEAYNQSLQVITRDNRPVEWAQLMVNLAAAYQDRIKGDRVQNIEDAITIYKQSLQVIDRGVMPGEFAIAMMNLSGAYLKRIEIDRAQNIEDAIIILVQLLQVITRDEMPVEWATSMMNLGIAYSNRIWDDRAENIEKSIGALEQSLQVMTCDGMPVEWATSMMNLGNAYTYRLRDDRAENIEKSINAYEQSLQVMTRQFMVFERAELLVNLGNAYADRIRGGRAENIKKSIDAYEQSLDIFTPEAHPDNCRLSARLLANLYADNKRWDDAQRPYSDALAAVEVLYQAAISTSSQEVELSETDNLYRRAAYAYAKVDKLTMAVTTLEQGRARRLSEALQRDRADLETIRQINPDLAKRYQTAANAINHLESTERRINTDNESPQYSQEDFRQHAIQARQALKDCLTEIRQIPGYEKFLALPTFEDVAATIQPDHPLVYILSTPNGSLALILTTAGVSLLWLNDLTEPQLRDTLDNVWFKAYRASRTNRQAWFEIIDTVTHQIWNWMMAPVVSHLQRNNLSKAILIPTGYLSYLPLHAAWTPDPTKRNGRRYALDAIQFTYAPNALSLDAARTVANQTSATTLLAVNEPQPVDASPLPSSEAEIDKAVSTVGKGNWLSRT